MGGDAWGGLPTSIQAFLQLRPWGRHAPPQPAPTPLREPSGPSPGSKGSSCRHWTCSTLCPSARNSRPPNSPVHCQGLLRSLPGPSPADLAAGEPTCGLGLATWLPRAYERHLAPSGSQVGKPEAAPQPTAPSPKEPGCSGHSHPRSTFCVQPDDGQRPVDRRPKHPRARSDLLGAAAESQHLLCAH